MQPLLLLKAASPFKKQVVIVFGVLLTILSLPVIGLVSMVDFGNVGDTNGVYYSGPVSTTNTYIFGYSTFLGIPLPCKTLKSNALSWGVRFENIGGVTSIHT